MSDPTTNEKTVPWSVALIIIGMIVLMMVCIIWALAPSMMPQPLYDLVASALPKEVVQIFPTPTTAVAVPTLTAIAPILLPETPIDPEKSSFVSLKDAPTRIPGKGEPARIMIPAIDLDAPVNAIGLMPIEYNGETYYQWDVPNDYAAGWHENSAQLGRTGNTVLNGHHNVYGEVFRDLIDLEEGDKIVLKDPYQTFTYRITEKQLLAERGQPLSVRLENASWIEPTADERITLITCWPYTDNTHRLIIVAEPIIPVHSNDDRD